MHRKFAAWFIVATFVIWIAVDVWLNANGGPTESQLIAMWAKESTFWPFLMGFLVGHWFYSRRNPSGYRWIFALGIWAILIVWDVWWSHTTHDNFYPWFRNSWIFCTAGVPAGSYLWGQTNSDSPVS